MKTFIPIKALRSKFKINSIRKKMMIYFIVMFLMSGLVSLYISVNSSQLLKDIDRLFALSVLLDEIEQSLNQTHESLTVYVESKSLDSLNLYMESSEYMETLSFELRGSYASDRGALSAEKIGNMVERYNQYGAKAIVAKRGRDIDACRVAYDSAMDTRENIQRVLQELKLEQLDLNLVTYETLAHNSKRAQWFNLIMILDMLLLTILLVYQVTDKITNPIIKLSEAADEMTRGHFDGESIIVEGEDEVKIMAQAFDEMRQSIKQSIEDLKKANEIKSQLFEKELQNVKMQTLLNDAELRSLQSQINPHFLFNSLNAGVQLAMMEGADQTLEFLEDMSAIFRYNIRPLEDLVRIRDEMGTVKAYCNMMKVRFGDRAKFDLIISEELEEQWILPMILQPIVENAFIHGIGKRESGGAIVVCVSKLSEGLMELSVSDNGGGMTEEKVSRILNKDSSGKRKLVQPKKSHSTGIGAGNVIQRLSLYYGDRANMNIESTMGEGTTFRITVPIIEN